MTALSDSISLGGENPDRPATPADRFAGTLDNPNDVATGVTPVVWLTTLPVPLVRVPSPSRPRPVPRRASRRARGVRSPLGLRLFVSVLVAVFLAAAVGLGLLGLRPDWRVSLRSHGAVAAPIRAAQAAAKSNDVGLVSSTSTAVTFGLPVSSYSIVVTVAHRAWIVVKAPFGASSALVATTLAPALSPMSIPIEGSSSITVAAMVQSISILAGANVLRTIENPTLGTAYTFIPRAGAGK